MMSKKSRNLDAYGKERCRDITITMPQEMREGPDVICFKPDQELSFELYFVDAGCAYITLDFGMDVYISLVDNFLAEESDTEEEILKKTLSFDLFHAFFHCIADPNYTIYHWALYGNLKDRLDTTEDEDPKYWHGKETSKN